MHSSEITSGTRHLTASMVVIDPDTEQVLLIHHAAADLWMFPGGHVDPDETPAEAAIREVLEETGVQATAYGRPRDLPDFMTWHPSPFLTAGLRRGGHLGSQER
jgi:8-oxo-dGTP pyrophosphatase MutT (NUDIX family)